MTVTMSFKPGWYARIMLWMVTLLHIAVSQASGLHHVASNQTWTADNGKAIVMFYHPSEEYDFYESIRVMLHWLKRDPLRCTCLPVVVLCTQAVPQDKVKMLILDGAKIRRIQVPEIQLRSNPDDFSVNRWASTMAKLEVFNLTEFSDVVYVDADMVLFEPLDSIFSYVDEHYDRSGYFVAAVPNSWGIIYQDFRLDNPEFNSGIMYLRPSARHFNRLLQLGTENPKKYRMDQDLLNEYFGPEGRYPWRHLPSKFNRQFVNKVGDLTPDVVAVHEKGFWKQGATVVYKMYEAGLEAVQTWDKQILLYMKLSKYKPRDVAYKLQHGWACQKCMVHH